MKELVMKVKHFLNVKDKDGCNITILGGSLNCNLEKGEAVEIHTATDVIKTSVDEIKCYSKDLDKALQGLSCGLGFACIGHMVFRVTEPIINPYSPKDDLVKYLEWDRRANEAQGVYIFREVDDDAFTVERSQPYSERDHSKPNFLFLHGPD